MPAKPEQLVDNVRNNILNAALARILHYGYHKTTMAEIAEDTGMSAANLYRYFENKQEILAHCASHFLDERLERLRALTTDADASPREKLERYVHELVSNSHALAGKDSRVGEVVDTVTRERPDVVRSKNELHHALLADVLRAGNACGEFAVRDVETCARDLHCAFTLFDVPLFVGFYSRQEFDDRASGMVNLLIEGLRARSAT